MAANSLVDLEHVSMSNSFDDASAILSSKNVQDVFGKYTLVFQDKWKINWHPSELYEAGNFGAVAALTNF